MGAYPRPATRDPLLFDLVLKLVVMGRTMSAFVVAPQEFRKKPAELKKWIARSVGYAATLPPKKKKKA